MKKTFGWITEWINVPCCGGTLSWKSEEISWNNCFLLFFILYFNTRSFQLSITKKGTLCGTQKGLCRHECSKSSCLCKCSWRRKWVTRGQVVAVSNNNNSTQRFCDIYINPNPTSWLSEVVCLFCISWRSVSWGFCFKMHPIGDSCPIFGLASSVWERGASSEAEI